eukprot:3051177-Rhodomonas_salina.1
MAAAAATKESLWLRKLLGDLETEVDVIHIQADNQSAIKLLRNPMTSMRSKHIDVIYHFARERVMRGEVKFHYVRTEHMVADALTKPVSASKHHLKSPKSVNRLWAPASTVFTAFNFGRCVIATRRC